MTPPITQFVVKLHSRCDLACDHCYVYEHADQSWRHKPLAISHTTVERAAERIASHAAAHLLDEVRIVLHGGEPLLLGAARLRTLLATLCPPISAVTELDLRIHTNGVLLDDRLCELFAEYGVQVGVSLDGDRNAQDRHRLFADGRSSHAHVRRALALLRQPRYRHLYAGILCTIDLSNDPIAVYQALLAEAPPRLDLLLPHATWDHPPSRPPDIPAPYAAWLRRIYRLWRADGRPVPIRLFDSLLSAARGGPSFSEAIGLDPADLLVIETDGTWEQADSLKTAYDGAPTTGMNIFSHSVDEAAAHPGIAARLGGLSTLCAVCRSCPVVRICGGGLYAHRHRHGTGFDNPSVYCADLKALITEVKARPRVAFPSPPAPISSHAISVEIFDSLAAGPGGSTEIASLVEVRSSITRALVATVGSDSSGTGELGHIASDGWALLSSLDVERPAAVREVFAYPHVEAWAVRCLDPPAGADIALDRAHLADLAAAAALRAAARTTLALPVRDGLVHLPSVGALTVDRAASGSVRLSISPDGLAASGIVDWRPVRRCGADGSSLVTEDVDPFRDCHRWPTADRLADTTWHVWRSALRAALRRLAHEVPDYARAVEAGLHTVVPLRPDPDGRERSSTVRNAFGAIAVALPSDTGELAALLLHEFQHVKLNALLELYDLSYPGDTRRLRIPWRPDPRPVESVLHDVYAHLALAELWRSRARGARDDRADVKFHQFRSWIRDGLDGLSAKDVLTSSGERFVAGMRATVDRWSNA